MIDPIEEFCQNGFLAVRDAVTADVVHDCVDVIEAVLLGVSVDLRAPETWFPSTTDPGDAGWHIDGSYDVDDQ